jgi:hypothetical protein
MDNMVYQIVTDLPLEHELFYWGRLMAEEQVEDRMPNIQNPTSKDVIEYITYLRPYMSYIVRTATAEGLCDPKDPTNVVGEFTLTSAIGKVARLHFSTSPDLSPRERIDMVRVNTRLVLRNPKISALAGITPHRKAVLLLLKAGWRKLGVLPDSIKTHNGYVDGTLMIANR